MTSEVRGKESGVGDIELLVAVFWGVIWLKPDLKIKTRAAKGIKMRMGRKSLGDINIRLFEYSVERSFVFVNTIAYIKEYPCGTARILLFIIS